MEWYSIRALSFPASWGALFISFFMTSIIFYRKKDSHVYDWYSNAIFLFFIVWKGSIIVFRFKEVLEHPLSLLYFNGGVKGYWAGIAAVLLYTLMKLKRSNLVSEEAILSWICTVAIYESAFCILNKESISAILFQLCLGSILFWLLIKKRGQGAWSEQLLLLYTGIQAVYYSLHSNLISIPVVTYIIVAICLSIGKRR